MKPKNTQFLCFVRYFYQAMTYQKSEWSFFDQGSIDGKSEVNMEKCHLVAELKLKMLNMQKVTFSISTSPPGGAFKLSLHFSYLWNIAQKSIIQIFDTLNINKFHLKFAPCISGILKTNGTGKWSVCFIWNDAIVCNETNVSHRSSSDSMTKCWDFHFIAVRCDSMPKIALLSHEKVK